MSLLSPVAWALTAANLDGLPKLVADGKNTEHGPTALHDDGPALFDTRGEDEHANVVAAISRSLLTENQLYLSCL